CGKPMSPHPSAARVGPAYVANPSGGQPQPASIPGSPAVATANAANAASYVPPTRVNNANAVSTANNANAAAQTCPRCGQGTTPGLPFCGYCGTLVGRRVSVQMGAGDAPASGGT